MWKKLMTLAIAAALAGGAMAQQKSDEQAKQEAQVQDAELQRRVAQEALLAKQRAAQAQRDRALADQARAEEQLIEAQQLQKLRRDQNQAQAEWRRFATARQTRREKVTYCGISTSEPPPVLSEQLKLSHGMGLVIDYVEPNSPAAKVGLKQYDVITRMNDQLLSNSEQLGVLVRMKKPTDDATFTLIRQGQPTTINVELEAKEMDVEVEQAATPANFAPQAVTIRPDGVLAVEPRAAAAGFGGGGAMGGGGMVAFTNVTGNAQTAWSDGQHNLTLQLRDGKAVSMTATDATGKEIFKGPVETEEQRKALPADLAAALEKARAVMPPQAGFRLTPAARNRARVLTSTENDVLLLARVMDGKVTNAFAFSTADGKTLFDGPTKTDEERKALPAAVAKQLETLEKNQAAAGEFGVVGRN